MEPRASLTTYVCITLVAITLLALRGFAGTATGLAVGLATFAATLDFSYLVRRHPRKVLVLAHRKALDRIVRTQWLLLLGVGAGISQTIKAVGIAPLSDASIFVTAPIFGLTVGAAAIYASSLVDWYWILPKVSGIVAPPPCTQVGGKLHHGTTKIWYFHRATTTAVITFVLAGVPAYIAGTIEDSGSTRAILTAFGAALAIGFNAVNAGTVWAFRQFLNPRVTVGTIVRKRRDVEDLMPQDAYVMDVAIQGVKYSFETDACGRFRDTGELMPFAEVERAPIARRNEPICPSLADCRAVNWYCLRNPNAHTARSSETNDRAPLPEGSPVR